MPDRDTLLSRLRLATGLRWRAMLKRLTARAAHRSDNPQSILLIKLHGLGELVCATPAFHAVRRRYPEARAELLTHESLAPLYEGAELVDRIIPWKADNFAEAREMAKVLRRERGEPYDLALNFDGCSAYSRWVALSVPAHAVVGFGPEGKSLGGYLPSVPWTHNRHLRALGLDLVAAVDANEFEPGLVAPPLSEHECAVADQTLRKSADPHDRFVGINMNVSEWSSAPNWPAEKWVLLAQTLESLPEYRVVFFGTEEEQTYVSRHVKSLEMINLAGLTTARQYAALLSRMDLFVSPESGAVQLAAALAVPTLSLYARARYFHAHPPVEERHVVLTDPPAHIAEMDLSLQASPPQPGPRTHQTTVHGAGPAQSIIAVTETAENTETVRENAATTAGPPIQLAIPLAEVRRAALAQLNHLAEPSEPMWE